MTHDHDERQRAIKVREDHLGGRKCPGCPDDGGPCLVEQMWHDFIIEIGAGRHLAGSRS